MLNGTFDCFPTNKFLTIHVIEKRKQLNDGICHSRYKKKSFLTQFMQFWWNSISECLSTISYKTMDSCWPFDRSIILFWFYFILVILLMIYNSIQFIFILLFFCTFFSSFFIFNVNCIFWHCDELWMFFFSNSPWFFRFSSIYYYDWVYGYEEKSYGEEEEKKQLFIALHLSNSIQSNSIQFNPIIISGNMVLQSNWRNWYFIIVRSNNFNLFLFVFSIFFC